MSTKGLYYRGGARLIVATRLITAGRFNVLISGETALKFAIMVSTFSGVSYGLLSLGLGHRTGNFFLLLLFTGIAFIVFCGVLLLVDELLGKAGVIERRF